MTKSQLAAYQKAFSSQVSLLDFDIARFIMTAQSLKFFTYAQRWAQSPPIVARPTLFQSVCAMIVDVIETGYDPEAQSWWVLGKNFKQVSVAQMNLALFGQMIDSMNGKDLEWLEVKKEFFAFLEINCGLGWRKLATQLQAVSQKQTALAA